MDYLNNDIIIIIAFLIHFLKLIYLNYVKSKKYYDQQ